MSILSSRVPSNLVNRFSSRAVVDVHRLIQESFKLLGGVILLLIASTAQAHADMERMIVELRGQLVKRKWSWPLAYVLKLPLSLIQALIRTLQSSSSWSTDRTLLWGMAILGVRDILGDDRL